MYETVRTLSIAIVEQFPLSLLASAALLSFALVTLGLRRFSQSGMLWPSAPVSLFWTWPICLWGLESIRMLHWLMFSGQTCGFYVFANYLPRWQSVVFCSVYCLVLVFSAVWVSLRVALNVSPRSYFNGPLGWSLRFGVFSVLIIMCGLFCNFFRIT